MCYGKKRPTYTTWWVPTAVWKKGKPRREINSHTTDFCCSAWCRIAAPKSQRSAWSIIWRCLCFTKWSRGAYCVPRILHEADRKATPGSVVDLTKTVIDYGYDPEEAAEARYARLDYQTEADRAESEYALQLYTVRRFLPRLEKAGVSVKVGFKRVSPEPTGEEEGIDWHICRMLIYC